jgi:hypothetical protein
LDKSQADKEKNLTPGHVVANMRIAPLLVLTSEDWPTQPD